MSEDTAYTDAVESARRALGAELRPEVAAAFDQLGQAALDTFAESGGADLGDAEVAIEEVLLAVWTEAASAFAAESYDALVPPSKLDPPDAGTWAEQIRLFLFGEDSYGAAMVASITQTLRDRFAALAEAAREALGSGETDADVVEEMREAWTEIAGTRAAVVVETEVVGASNYGVHLGAEAAAAAVPEGFDKVWDAVIDEDTRETHSAANGQRVRLGDSFVLGGLSTPWPGHPSLPPGERINCRCTVSFFPAETVRSAGTRSANEQSVYAFEKAERDAAIREAYPALKSKHGSAYALTVLAEEHAVSERTVERALGWG